MGWLVSDAHVLASAEVATDRRARRHGLLHRDGFEGALVLRPCRWVHTVGMRFALDVAWLDRTGRVLRTASLRPGRLSAWIPRATGVVEAEQGRFAPWGLVVGVGTDIRPSPGVDGTGA